MVNVGWASVVVRVGFFSVCRNDMGVGWVCGRMLLTVGWVSGGCVVGGFVFVVPAILECAVVGVAVWSR